MYQKPVTPFVSITFNPIFYPCTQGPPLLSCTGFLSLVPPVCGLSDDPAETMLGRGQGQSGWEHAAAYHPALLGSW